MRKTEREKFKKVLNEMRDGLAENAQRALSGDMQLDPDDFPDEIDSASSDANLAFIGRLRERERVLLQKIDQALVRIEEGEYGRCSLCEEEIGIKRLQARPVATLCIDCKSQQEKLER
ncbi:MAG: RNA polymerase-binding protein DksA [Myxococcota bacterium]|nr:RNA polymerase-binding protein DksA [Myxococcota bacterium]MEE2703653.1 RNA polymerase-binding protein DksA [Myxococcota bacterium]